ncbi:hypothetical protein K1719_019631 [Acacia pycnantha]|nr:hypothetical protein K1719_019631 [Acacia pycnantha]
MYQTEGIYPNTLVIADCEIVKPRVASEDINRFCEDSRSRNIKKYKAIIHPGEVNRIREIPENKNLLVVHTDRPEVLIWDIEAQPARHAIPGAEPSLPNLILAGHTADAQFALATSPSQPYVLSGGKDMNVVLWSLNDQITSLAAEPNYRLGSHYFGYRNYNPVVTPRGIFRGHTNTVEDVQFNPANPQEFCSVGDDSKLMLWDARVGPYPVIKVEDAHHEEDIHCVEWNNFNLNYILTGSADRSVHMYDRRNLNDVHGLQNPVYTFEGHDASVLCVQWCPDKESVFGTSGDDGIINIWDYEKVERATPPLGLRRERAPPGLFFRHIGHRYKAIEFQWNPSDPWTIASLSHDCRGRGGGTLQMWRMMDVIYEEVAENEERNIMTELNMFRPCTVGRSLSSIKDLCFTF